MEEMVTPEKVTPEESEGVSMTSETVTETTAADSMMQSEQEEKKTFVITGECW